MNRTTLVLLLIVCAIAAVAGWALNRKDSGEETTDADEGAGTIDEWADAGATRIRLTALPDRAGIDAVNHSGRKGIKEFLPEAVGVGPAWLDYDNDGLLDLYVPDGDVFSNYTFELLVDPESSVRRAYLTEKPDRPEKFTDRLWRNTGDGTFEDVTEQARVGDLRWSYGATTFDYNGDGWTDIFVTNFGQNRLYENQGDGTFKDVAEAVGVAGDRAGWSTCAGVGDVDGDGRLDIYVAQYSDPAAEVDRQRVKRDMAETVPVESITGRDCRWRSLPAYCGPRGLVGQHDTMFRQREDGTFEDVTEAWGLVPRVAKYGFTTLLFDFNEDGLLDIYVANDSEENFMWEQERGADGQVRFRDTSDTLGVKYGHNLSAQASMGAAVGDFNQDGLFDIFVTNFSHDYNNIYLGHRAGQQYGTFFFKDRGLQVMGQAVFYDLSWGCGWYDLDNDGDLDLYFANGHVYKEIDLFEKTGSRYEQHNTLFECMSAEALGFREIGTKGQQNAPSGVDPVNLFAGDGMELTQCTRGAAFADWNNDGRMDVFLQNMNAKPDMLLNTSESGPDARWVKLVVAQPGGNRDGIGAVIEVTTGERVQRFAVTRATSFLGTDDPRVHVGLGTHETCDVKVIWPGQERATTEYKGLAAGALWKLDRASGAATDLKMQGFDVATK